MFLFHIMLCFGFSDLDLSGTLADACSIIFAMYWLCCLLSTHIAIAQLQRVSSHSQQNSSNKLLSCDFSSCGREATAFDPEDVSSLE